MTRSPTGLVGTLDLFSDDSRPLQSTTLMARQFTHDVASTNWSEKRFFASFFISMTRETETGRTNRHDPGNAKPFHSSSVGRSANQQRSFRDGLASN
jgi:hypothetical protein